MQCHKENYYLKNFLNERSTKKKEEISQFIQEHFENMIRSKYVGPIKLDDNEFKDIILTDACFIFELFSLTCERKRPEDYILSTPLLLYWTKKDLVMFENQIPLSFLQNLYDFTNPKPGHSPSFLELSMKFFQLKIPSDHLDGIKHFTDLYRRSWLPKENFKSHYRTNFYDLRYTATKLDKVGVDFAPPPPKEDSTPLTRVRVSQQGWRWCKFIPCLNSLKLQLPVLEIQNNTECFLLNVMIMEQCQPDLQSKTPICSYIWLMDKLINTEEDVELLVEKKVISHCLESNMAVANMINKLPKNIYVENFIYNDECKPLNEFYERWYNRAKETLKRVYFKDLWTTSSTCVAGLVVLFTAISAIESLKSLLGN
ncbi:uncharacterized protein LOC133783690 [Humulus lupulus]|uniref:uncharacterized protein LOC133781393 n=1 Tax=Humulus lupulus TaxID=3486 RepID=UPI002B40C43B|nr:uncharacterized protein LOC133781393 [Humulus lupulus]XP_062079324.1 uncharacterized protein LOC133783690 [Humulus lupulus]